MTDTRTGSWTRWQTGLIAALLALSALPAATPSRAQSPADWLTGLQAPMTSPAETEKKPDMIVAVPMAARLTSDGEVISTGLVWRVYEHAGQDTRGRLIGTQEVAQPVFRLEPGEYYVNAAFGRAHITRRITISGTTTETPVEEFVINAGGLRLNAQVDGAAAAANTVTYAIYSDRDQTDNRRLILSGAKPGLVMRLNAGIYHIVSTYGDCNAVVKSDVTVEAGKLTEATVTHSAAKATFKLVQRAGGEALPDTQWKIQSPQGDDVKESVGALPTHILAPGTYTVIAKSQGREFQRDFTLANGETTQVELIMK